MELSDEASDIRKGEELPQNKIEAFIRENMEGIAGPIVIRQFPSGHSNLTYLILAGNREMVLRCPPHGTKARTAHDMGREYRILTALQTAYPYCPKPLAYSEDKRILGSPFYLMERLKGIIIRRDLPGQLALTPADTTRLFENILKVQYQLHAIDFEKIGLETFGKPDGYVTRQVDGWSRRYRAARTPDVPDGKKVMDWLSDNMPQEAHPPAILHNDFKFDNVILDPENPFTVIGVLDWEMATIGDPLMDLGATLGYWVQKGDPKEMQALRMGPTNAPGALTRKEMVCRYEQFSGRKIENFNFYYCFGVFRLATIVQQIYYRYFHGQTADKRFKNLAFSVNTLINTAERIVKEGDV
ncbi:MAG: phosphotransferase family protein [Proteobacteria bacterium]|nr:phosphotransferase family protein [Pseudomonadota bacterium]MBU1582983.1 phosphotransferase family protein [Pseudomonadota bacterium]MBU2456118.1 phosphotransferase family protein [Pseudomonadota bacterium]MBU2631776.1 phosphotransferase family protein [Pseudomonadota bacterium]